MASFLRPLVSRRVQPAKAAADENQLFGRGRTGKAVALRQRSVLGDVSNTVGQQNPSEGTFKKPAFKVYRDTQAPSAATARPARPTSRATQGGTRFTTGSSTVGGSRLHTSRPAARPKEAAVEPVQWQVSKLKIDEVDKPDIKNPQAVVEYIADIYEHLNENEMKFAPKPDYLKNQTQLNEKMREAVVDYLVDVHYKFQMRSDTLYLAINLLDRYMSVKSVTRRVLQLVGVTCMLIAAKYEETYPPPIEHFRYITDSSCTRDDIKQMERNILAVLNFNLTVASPLLFARRWAKISCSDVRTNMMVKFLMELELMEYRMLQFSPSMQAAAATFLARKTTKIATAWPETLVKHSGYTEAELMPCVGILEEVVRSSKASTKIGAVRKKYSRRPYAAVATLI